jgi:hypothetical protein
MKHPPEEVGVGEHERTLIQWFSGICFEQWF